MTKHCACGKTKTIQPYNASGSMKFTCDACKLKLPVILDKKLEEVTDCLNSIFH